MLLDIVAKSLYSEKEVSTRHFTFLCTNSGAPNSIMFTLTACIEQGGFLASGCGPDVRRMGFRLPTGGRDALLLHGGSYLC
jgi:hypothetical protein